MTTDSDQEEGTAGLFDDPEGYYPPTPPPTTQSYTLKTGKTLTLHLVGHSPLEAHHLWNGSRVVSEFFETDPTRVQGKTILELGAGAGLPSLVCGILGAKKVVVTDFPDIDLVINMQKNIDKCDDTVEGNGKIKDTVAALGFVWGGDVEPLLAQLPGDEDEKFDVLILADLLFRHSEHGKLVLTIQEAMKKAPESAAYVFFTSYRPWLRQKDLAFFDIARENGFVVDKILERKMDKPLFENDPGDVEVQKTVTGFTVRWPLGN